jgi:hypothetical protein
MGTLLYFFSGGTARIQALIYAAIAMLVICMGLASWALIERVRAAQAITEKVRAEGERDRAIDQGRVLADSTERCSAGVERVAKLAGEAIGTSRGLLEEARRLHAGGRAMADEIEQRLAKKAGVRADGRPKSCDDAYDELEKIRGP